MERALPQQTKLQLNLQYIDFIGKNRTITPHLGECMDHNAVKTFGPFSSADESLEVWAVLFRRQISSGTLPPFFLKGLEQTPLSDTCYPSVNTVDNFLAPFDWKAVVVDTSLSFAQLCDLFYHRHFPVPNFIRNTNNLEYTKTPDVFSRCFAQLPLLFHEDYRKVLIEFGRLNQIAVADKEQFSIWLQRQYWHSIEKGILVHGGTIEPTGVQLIDSMAERTHCMDPAVHKIYGMHPVIRAPIVSETYPSVYYTFEDYSQIKRSLLDFERMYKNA